jgi:AAA domain
MAIDPTPFYQEIPAKLNGPDRAVSRFALMPFYKIKVGTTGAYLVKGLVPREGLIVIWGPPKCGKSFWTFDLVMHVVLGWSYRGRRVLQGPVVYVACEGGHGFAARIEAYRQAHLQGYEGDVPFFLVPARLALFEDHQELITEIRRTVNKTEPVAVVIDTLNRSLTGSENSDQDMSAYIKAADVIHETFNCAVMIVHHCGTEGTRPRGHTSLSGAVEAQIAVKRTTNGAATARVEYMKDGPEGDEIAFHLEQVVIGTDDDGESMTSCIVMESELVSADTAMPKLGKNEQTMFDILAEHMPDGLTKEEWNELGREDGIGKNRRADLNDCRRTLKNKRLVHEGQDRWYITTR